jgi:hypothetical protein
VCAPGGAGRGAHERTNYPYPVPLYIGVWRRTVAYGWRRILFLQYDLFAFATTFVRSVCAAAVNCKKNRSLCYIVACFGFC